MSDKANFIAGLLLVWLGGFLMGLGVAGAYLKSHNTDKIQAVDKDESK